MNYENLHEFIGGVYHQDWSLDFPDQESAIRYFLSTSDSEFIQRVLLEIDELLREQRSEKRLKKTVQRDFSGNIVPQKTPQRWHDWLVWLREEIKASSADANP
ncbi:contact-dependent growth inhibition system immunity protein [Nocardiopsis gilva]|uniref:contact-dependent growth inhibition system immunity protein n=1 Tax=Nocardiopsis gilva TaxID=280236 RepID=UPI001268E764|nr:contact-dependent growth inhibition system immunity protein [Nocardiopsis gilva]